VATLLGGLVLLGLAPFDLANQEGSISSLVIAVLIDIGLAALAILKGKPLLGLFGVFVPFFSLVAVVRLASPTSPWARRRYVADSPKMARCHERFRARAPPPHMAERRDRRDAVGAVDCASMDRTAALDLTLLAGARTLLRRPRA